MLGCIYLIFSLRFRNHFLCQLKRRNKMEWIGYFMYAFRKEFCGTKRSYSISIETSMINANTKQCGAVSLNILHISFLQIHRYNLDENEPRRQSQEHAMSIIKCNLSNSDMRKLTSGSQLENKCTIGVNLFFCANWCGLFAYTILTFLLK